MLRLDSPLSADEEEAITAAMDAAFAVRRELGPGFRERIYHRALCLELDERGISYESEKLIAVRYKKWVIPGHKVDVIVAERVLLELKAVPELKRVHKFQVVSYLRATGLRAALLINFNTPMLKEGLKRIVLTKAGGAKVR